MYVRRLWVRAKCHYQSFSSCTKDICATFDIIHYFVLHSFTPFCFEPLLRVRQVFERSVDWSSIFRIFSTSQSNALFFSVLERSTKTFLFVVGVGKGKITWLAVLIGIKRKRARERELTLSLSERISSKFVLVCVSLEEAYKNEMSMGKEWRNAKWRELGVWAGAVLFYRPKSMRMAGKSAIRAGERLESWPKQQGKP